MALTCDPNTNKITVQEIIDAINANTTAINNLINNPHNQTKWDVETVGNVSTLYMDLATGQDTSLGNLP